MAGCKTVEHKEKQKNTKKKELTYRILVSTTGCSKNDDDYKDWNEFNEEEKQVIREKIGIQFFESLGYKNVRAV